MCIGGGITSSGAGASIANSFLSSSLFSLPTILALLLFVAIAVAWNYFMGVPSRWQMHACQYTAMILSFGSIFEKGIFEELIDVLFAMLWRR